MEIYVAKSGKESGPFTKEQLASMLESDMVAKGDLVWHEGLPEWIPVHQFLGLRPPVPAAIPDDFEPAPFPVYSSQSSPPNPSGASSAQPGKSIYPMLAAGQQPYFAVSPAKLIVMSICTFKFYEFYWFYKHWNQIRITKRQEVLPFLRAMFSIFTCHSLFTRIKDEAQSSGVSVAFNPVFLAASYIVPSLFWNGSAGILCFLGFGTLWSLVTMQRVANSLNERFAPDADKNERYSAANIVFMVIGAIFYILVIVGLFAKSIDSPSSSRAPLLPGSASPTLVDRETVVRHTGISGVYQDGGWRWDFRSNGTLEYTGNIGGINSGFKGTYIVRNGNVRAVLEDGRTADFELEGNGDLTSQGERLPRVR